LPPKTDFFNRLISFKAALNGREASAAEVMAKAIELDKRFGHLFTFLP
jgi:hypothetical protein